jgi:AcrR family transcriptional regulator
MPASAKVRIRVDKERLVDVAADLVNRNGLENLSMNELALALGVRTPSLYSHVDGLDAVKRLLALRGLEALDRRIARAAVGKSSGDAVRAVFHAFRDCARAAPGVNAAALPTPPRDDKEWNAAKDQTTRTILTAMSGYGLQGDEEIHALRGLRSIALGFVSLETSGAFKNPVDRDESYEWLIESFLTSLTEMKKTKSRMKKAGGKP